MAPMAAVNSVAKCGGILLLSTCRRQLRRPMVLFPAANVKSGALLASRGGGGGGLRICRASSASANDVEVAAASSSDPATEVKEAGPEPEPESEEERMRKIGEAASVLDIRVGQVLKAWRHEEADSLYVEEVDVGEPEPRIICSGLVKYVPLQELQGRNVVVLANLKPRNMRGVKSNGMLLAASDASHENVELLLPPEGSMPGERIWFGSEDEKEKQPLPATPNQVQKKKIWESVQPHLKTDASCNAMLGHHFMRTSLGMVVCKSLKNANIS
ncbi:aminoacyl tRNA synthase complex-interacting multifunctional protein 1 [Rhodamnia argentea]|uniref:Aminoacyl tRNA synthase complex-interacting multifunctional protein 1 n=1 Tax=Rhodamnia argentea TaxID=178133 RepID=A0A8B8P056_9MYRT|nr:aminoacyl tRNA synthase complex-interacting multifunctional protein 1 [Rhodamnia argentea]